MSEPENERMSKEEIQDLKDRATLPLTHQLLADICSLQEDVEELEEENNNFREREAYFAKALGVCDGGQYRADWASSIKRLLAERAELETRIEQLTKALEFYADEGNWGLGWTSTNSGALNFPGMWDCGSVARATLSDLRKEF